MSPSLHPASSADGELDLYSGRVNTALDITSTWDRIMCLSLRGARIRLGMPASLCV